MADHTSGELFATHYRLLKRIGRGGFGSVYHATDLRDEKHVALKILASNRLDETTRLRFTREAELARKLTHPNAVQLFDFGEDSSNTPYLAFELLNGEPLTKRLERERGQTEERTAQLALKVLEVLTEAHGLGVVHRDIKPANVMLCDYAGQRDFIKLLDFGIAKRAGAEATQLTAIDEFVGTPRYMAPELLAAHPATPACDLYSLGIMMAEMMAGTSVYRGSPIEVCMLVLAPDPVPLPDIVKSSRLAGVIQKATMKDPAERYASAQAMMGDLHGALGGVLGPRRSRSDTGMRAVQVPQQSAPPIHVPESAAPMPNFRSTVPPTSAMPQSTMPPRPRRRSSGTLKLVLLLIAGLLFGALIVAGTFFIMKFRQTREQASLEPTVTSMPPTRFERDALKAKLANLKYKVDSESGSTLYASNGDKSAVIAVRELLGPNDDSALDARRREGSAVTREGQWALDVRVEKNHAIDAAAGAELLAQLAP